MSTITYLRSFRIFGIALFDLIGTILGILIGLKVLFPNREVSFYISWTILLMMPLSVISHLIFRVPTQFNYYLELSRKPGL